jgi:hypothetical protein
MTSRLAKDHIVSTATAPGPFKSDMNTRARDHETEVALQVSVKRIGTDVDSAGAAIWHRGRSLCSDGSCRSNARRRSRRR